MGLKMSVHSPYDQTGELYAYNHLYDAHHMIVLGNYMHENMCMMMTLSVHGNFVCVKMCIYSNMCFFANKMCVNMYYILTHDHAWEQQIVTVLKTAGV